MLVQFQKRGCNWSTKALRLIIRYTLETAFDYLPLSEEWAMIDLEPQISLTFVGAETMQEMNRETRGIDRVTDILSYPFLEFHEGERWVEIGPEEMDPETGKVFLGDLILCLDRAEEQAEQYGHSLQREVAFLTLHGLLHLLGYDHVEDEEAAERMEALQDFLLEQVGIDREMSGETAIAWVQKQSRIRQRMHKTYSIDENWNEELAEAFMPTLVETKAFEELEEEEMVVEPTREESHSTGESWMETCAPHQDFRSGFVTLVGQPNAGKSTLLNRISGQPLAIVTRKAQTTRHNIRAISNSDEAQIIFTDTPGLHDAQHRLGEYMQDSALRALREADLVLLLVDATKPRLSPIERNCCEQALRMQLPLFLVLTKVDLAVKERLLPTIARYAEEPGVHAVYPISAKNGEGVDDLLEAIRRELPRGPRYYDADAFTDQSERQIAAEMIREQVLLYTHEEVPHGTAVIIDSFEEILKEPRDSTHADLSEDSIEEERKLVRIHASILCDKKSHKGILIGKNGQSLKRIGQSARHRIQSMLGCKVYLELHVKVRPDWRNRRGILNDLGYSQT